jgi:hypothetical protein
MHLRNWVLAIAAIAVALLIPSTASAQATIAGVIRDASGAVLPGVTVEAASPALIQKVRSATSDGTGQYRITELPPGTYSVTMTLPGFSTVKREELVVSGTGVITVNGEMRVGGVQETITVTGESPLVDVQSTRRQQIVDDETLKALPATRGYNALVFLVPSITGGSNQIDLNPAMRIFYSHGGRGNEGRVSVDGLSVGSAFNGGGVSGYIVDTNSQEMQVALSGGLGETEMGGANVNFVPKTGGNTFSGNAFFSSAGQWSQGSNLDDRLRGFGLSDPPALYKTWDVSGSLGGPIKRDKLWFYGTYRDIGSHDQIFGMYANANAGNPNSWSYVPDKTLPARSAVSTTISAIRLTSQLTPKNKVGFYYDYQKQCNGSTLTTEKQDGACRTRGDDWIASGTTTNVAPEAASGAQGTSGGAFGYANTYQSVIQATYTSTLTSKLLLEAGVSSYMSKWGWMEPPGAITDLIQVQEQNAINGIDAQGNPFTMPANLTYRALDWNFNNMQNPTPWRAALSYVTGAHSMKFGYQGAYNRTDAFNHYNQNRLNYRFGSGVNALGQQVPNGIPNRLTMNYGDFLIKDRSQSTSLYAQDQWTMGRMTLQGAIRYDRAWSWSPDDQGIDHADRFHPDGGVSFPRTEGVTGFNDITPRAGVAYDLFGNGKTSIKVNLGKYLESANNQNRYTLMNPAQATRFQRTVNRAWTDANFNYVPECDLMNPAANGECGGWDNNTFGVALPPGAINPDILHGWGVRPSDWQFGASIQHEVLPRVSAEVGYNRRWFNGFTVTDNRATVASDYDLFTFTAPTGVGESLPVAGQTISAYNPNPRIAATADNYVTFADDYGETIQYWHGIDVNVNARLRNGLTFQGGTSTGRGIRDNCEVVAKVPELLLSGTPLTWQRPESCRVVEPWLTQVRGLAAYTIPKIDVAISASFQLKPGTLGVLGNDTATNGTSVAANYNVSNAEAQASLGRPLSLGATNTAVNLLLPGQLYGDRVNQVDMRFAKVLRFGRTRTLVGLDLYNLFNANPGLTYGQAWGTNGATWLRPQTVLYPRFVRFNATVDF